MTSPTRTRVLLVEDDAYVRAYAARVLRGAGYEVGEARTGAEALWAGADRPPDVVVTDLGLPDTTGARLVAVMRSRSRTDLPAVFMSGEVDEEGANDGMISAGSPFLPKPFLPDQLRQKIRDVLSGPRAGCRGNAVGV